MKQHVTKFYSPIQTVAFAIVIFFLAQFMASIILVGVGTLYGELSGRDVISELFKEGGVTGQFVYVLIVDALLVRLLYEVMRRRAITFASIGLNRVKPSHLVHAVLGFLAYLFIYIVSVSVAKALIPSLDITQEQQIGFDKTTSGLSLIPIFVSLVVLPPLVEEIMTRGFIFTSLRKQGVRFVLAAIITSVLFAAAHLNGAKEGLLWIAAIDTFILSMVMCYVREKSQSLWPSIGMHAIKNGLAFVLLFKMLG